MSWSAKQYLAFEDERTRPVRDLLNGVPGAAPSSIVDLGCGPGNSTEVLRARYPQAEICGIDSSEDMIAAARRRLPTLRFEQADVGAWSAQGAVDLLFANAVLQWAPDHARLLPKLLAMLGAGGRLAVQMPDNAGEPAIALMQTIAESGSWRTRLVNAEKGRMNVQKPDWYDALLRPLCARIDIWRTTYFHPLAGAAAVAEWFKGSSLRPFLDRLEPGEQTDFIDRYRSAVAEAYPCHSTGVLLLPFPRLFIVATK